MYIIYNFLVLCVCCLFVLPYFLYRCICEAGFTTRMRQSLGGLRDEEIASVAQTVFGFMALLSVKLLRQVH